MTEKRFMIDDCGTLIDMETRNTYDYVIDVKDLLNNLNKENEDLKNRIKELELLNNGLNYVLKYIRQIDVEVDIE